jgi:hypothetical protein
MRLRTTEAKGGALIGGGKGKAPGSPGFGIVLNRHGGDSIGEAKRPDPPSCIWRGAVLRC